MKIHGTDRSVSLKIFNKSKLCYLELCFIFDAQTQSERYITVHDLILLFSI